MTGAEIIIMRTIICCVSPTGKGFTHIYHLILTQPLELALLTHLHLTNLLDQPVLSIFFRLLTDAHGSSTSQGL